MATSPRNIYQNTLYTVALILDGISENREHVFMKIGLYIIKIRFVPALELNKCLRQEVGGVSRLKLSGKWSHRPPT